MAGVDETLSLPQIGWKTALDVMKDEIVQVQFTGCGCGEFSLSIVPFKQTSGNASEILKSTRRVQTSLPSQLSPSGNGLPPSFDLHTIGMFKSDAESTITFCLLLEAVGMSKCFISEGTLVARVINRKAVRSPA